tara:strand:- start:341 stop:2056 length:1716 start_codon:yes stop_codon:yes gene_type:complete
MFNEILQTIDGLSKKRLIFISILIFTSSMLEVLSLGLLLPLISALVEENNNQLIFFQYLSEFFNIENKTDYVQIVIFIIFIAFIVKFFSLSYLVLKINGFIAEVTIFLSKKLLSSHLNRTYVWHSNNNKSAFLNLITKEIQTFTGFTLQSLFHIVVDLFIFFSIIVFLFFFNIKIFLFLGIVSFIIFYGINFFSKKISYNLGKKKEKTSRKILILLNENLDGIKELILYNGGKYVLDNFVNFLKENLKVSVWHESLQDIVRFIIEIVGLIIILGIFYISFNNVDNSNNLTIQTLGIYAAALFKLMPIFNRISTRSQKLRYGLIASERIREFLKTKDDDFYKFRKEISFLNNIKLENINFQYKSEKIKVLDNVNLEIKKQNIVGIIGESGSGKTTLSNILMNLIKPDSGKIYLDNKNVLDDQLNYGKDIAFVSQRFFLTDNSLIENVTMSSSNINIKNLKFALKSSLLIKSILDKSLSLKKRLGNIGMKVSGGQLQRINIARALYRRPKILVLDEPTSALDFKSQLELGKILEKLKKEMTIIIISHSKDFLEICDEIYELKKGKLSKIKNLE